MTWNQWFWLAAATAFFAVPLCATIWPSGEAEPEMTEEERKLDEDCDRYW